VFRILLLALVSQSNARALNVALLQSWEAKFRQCVIEYTADSNIGPANFKCLNTATHVALYLVGKNGSQCVCDVHDGASLLFFPGDKPGHQWQRAYGTNQRDEVQGDRSRALMVLYRIGVTPSGEQTFSSLLAQSPTYSCKESAGRTMLTFMSPPGVHAQATNYQITLDSRTHLPLHFHSAWAKWVEDIDLRWSPDHELAKLGAVHSINNGKGVRGTDTWRIRSVRPLVESQIPSVPYKAEGYFDRALSVGFAPSFEEERIHEPLLRQTLRAAQGKMLREVSVPSGDLKCGPESLFFFVNLLGKNVSFERIQQAFAHPQYGSSLADLNVACDSLLPGTKLGKVDPANIAEIKTPAILSVNPAHFIVLLSVEKGSALLINPPYSVVRMRLQDLQTSFDGYLLWRPGS